MNVISAGVVSASHQADYHLSLSLYIYLSTFIPLSYLFLPFETLIIAAVCFIDPPPLLCCDCFEEQFRSFYLIVILIWKWRIFPQIWFRAESVRIHRYCCEISSVLHWIFDLASFLIRIVPSVHMYDHLAEVVEIVWHESLCTHRYCCANRLSYYDSLLFFTEFSIWLGFYSYCSYRYTQVYVRVYICMHV